MIFFLITDGNNHVICTANNREFAKSKAAGFLKGNPDHYVVTPLTNEGETVHLDVTVKG